MTAPPTRVLYRGGSVYTPADPFATAMLVDGGVVAWVGSEEAAGAQASSAEVVVELDGALVTPAFVDAHVHVTETGLALAGIDLSGASSVAQVLDAVAGAAAASPGRQLLGAGWDETGWPEGRAPTGEELARAAGGAEVYLARVDVHSAVVSPALASRAGLAALPGWSPDGRVEREAHHAARDATRALGADRRREVQLAALRAAAAAGIGSVHECAAPHVGSPQDLAALLALAGATSATRALDVPDVLALWGELATDAEHARALLDAVGPEHRRSLLGLGGDITVDGSIGSRTAALTEPYADAAAAGLPAGHRGHRYLDAAAVRDHVVACTRAGVQAGFHVIGDDAVATVLAGFEAAVAVVGLPAVGAAGHRLEHVEAVDAAGVATMARLGLLASVQPAFDAAWGGTDRMYAARLGADRAAALNPFAALAAAGVPLALGSDAPVTALAPWEGVRAAAFARTPEHRISVRGAFSAATRGGWRAARAEGGVLVPGAPATYAVWEPADLVVQVPDDRFTAWSTDARSGTPGLPDLTPGVAAPRCLRTAVRGAVVHDVDGWAQGARTGAGQVAGC